MTNTTDKACNTYQQTKTSRKEIAMSTEDRSTVRVFAPPTEKDERSFALRALINTFKDFEANPAFARIGDVYKALDDYESAALASGSLK